MEERDEYLDLQAGAERAMADLKEVLAPLARKHGADVGDVANLALLKHQNPADFARLHTAATQADKIAQATISNLQQKAQELHEALQRDDKASPTEKLHAWHLLERLR